MKEFLLALPFLEKMVLIFDLVYVLWCIVILKRKRVYPFSSPDRWTTVNVILVILNLYVFGNILLFHNIAEFSSIRCLQNH